MLNCKWPASIKYNAFFKCYCKYVSYCFCSLPACVFLFVFYVKRSRARLTVYSTPANWLIFSILYPSASWWRQSINNTNTEKNSSIRWVHFSLVIRFPSFFISTHTNFDIIPSISSTSFSFAFIRCCRFFVGTSNEVRRWNKLAPNEIKKITEWRAKREWKYTAPKKKTQNGMCIYKEWPWIIKKLKIIWFTMLVICAEVDAMSKKWYHHFSFDLIE